jgi:hypothetical protein
MWLVLHVAHLSTTSCDTPQEIYPGSKRNHFKAIKDKTGIPYENMVSGCDVRAGWLWCQVAGRAAVQQHFLHVWEHGERSWLGSSAQHWPSAWLAVQHCKQQPCLPADFDCQPMDFTHRCMVISSTKQPAHPARQAAA